MKETGGCRKKHNQTDVLQPWSWQSLNLRIRWDFLIAPTAYRTHVHLSSDVVPIFQLLFSRIAYIV